MKYTSRMLKVITVCQHDRIHAFVKADLWNALGNTIVEGGMYEISNFLITQAYGFYRPVRSPIKILFTQQNVI